MRGIFGIILLLGTSWGALSVEAALSSNNMSTIQILWTPIFKEQLLKQLGPDALDVKFEFKKNEWSQIEALSPNEKQSLMLSLPEKQLNPVHSLHQIWQFRLDYYSQHLERRIPITTLHQIQVLSSVVVAQEMIPMGVHLSQADLTIQPQWLPIHQWAKVVHEIEQSWDKLARKSIHKGTALITSDMEKIILVQNHQDVDVLYDQENFVIKTKGVALTQGGLGDLIKVQNVQTKKIFTGKIISHEQVKINF